MMFGRSIKYLNEIISNIEFFFNKITYKMTISVLKYIKLYLKCITRHQNHWFKLQSKNRPLPFDF